MMRAYVHDVPGGSELVMMLWNDGGPMKTKVNVADDKYRYAVRPDLFNYRAWTDVPYHLETGALAMDLSLDTNPLIIRLVEKHK